MTMEENNLKPCPFCGSKPIINRTNTIHTPAGYSVGYKVECLECHIYFGSCTDIHVEKGLPVIDRNGYQECIDMWNRRVGEDDDNS